MSSRGALSQGHLAYLPLLLLLLLLHFLLHLQSGPLSKPQQDARERLRAQGCLDVAVRVVALLLR